MTGRPEYVAGMMNVHGMTMKMKDCTYSELQPEKLRVWGQGCFAETHTWQRDREIVFKEPMRSFIEINIKKQPWCIKDVLKLQMKLHFHPNYISILALITTQLKSPKFMIIWMIWCKCWRHKPVSVFCVEKIWYPDLEICRPPWTSGTWRWWLAVKIADRALGPHK